MKHNKVGTYVGGVQNAYLINFLSYLFGICIKMVGSNHFYDGIYAQKNMFAFELTKLLEKT